MNLKGKRIFYVEDNPYNRSLTQLILEQHGARVWFERYGDSEDIFQRLESCLPIDLILLDLMLPQKISGYDVFDAIRSRSSFAHIPIVAISAADPSIEMTKARAKGLAGYIGKPINLVAFPGQIAALIAGEHVWSAR